jgi:hypothetical protein
LRRNALIEATLGYAVVAIVGLLGILPPGLQTQPGWPFPFRFDFAALSIGAGIAVAILAGLIFVCCVGAVATAAAGRYRTTAGLTAGLAPPTAPTVTARAARAMGRPPPVCRSGRPT